MTERLSGSRLRPALLCAVAVVAGLMALGAQGAGALSALELRAVDARFGLRGERAAGREIAIVGVDAKTLAALNVRPPIPRAHYARLIARLRAAGARVIAVDVQFVGATDPGDDRALLEAVERNGPVVLATHDTEAGPVPVPAGRRGAPGAVPASVGIPTDADGVVRRMLYAPVQLKSFPVRTAEVARGRPVSEAQFPANHAWIDFRGPPGTFRSHSLVDVLEGRVPVRELRGRVVLVGLTDPGLKDVFVTAASSTPMAGAEVQANALWTVLRGAPLRSVGGGVAAALVLLLALVPAVAGLRLPALIVLAVGVGAALAFVTVVQLAFNSGWIVPVVAPLLALALAAAGALAVDFLTERRRRRELEEVVAGLPGESPEFFLSYRRDQSGWPARILQTELAKRFGDSSVFMDLDSIGAGEEWPRRIEESIAEANVVLVLIGPYWLEARDPGGARRIDDPRDWVRLEIEAALGRPDIVLVPVLLDNATMPGEEDLPETLRPLARRNAVALSADDWNAGIDALVDSIRSGQIRDFLRRGGTGEEA